LYAIVAPIAGRRGVVGRGPAAVATGLGRALLGFGVDRCGRLAQPRFATGLLVFEVRRGAAAAAAPLRAFLDRRDGALVLVLLLARVIARLVAVGRGRLGRPGRSGCASTPAAGAPAAGLLLGV
jgi:hypothetical protein